MANFKESSVTFANYKTNSRPMAKRDQAKMGESWLLITINVTTDKILFGAGAAATTSY